MEYFTNLEPQTLLMYALGLLGAVVIVSFFIFRKTGSIVNNREVPSIRSTKVKIAFVMVAIAAAFFSAFLVLMAFMNSVDARDRDSYVRQCTGSVLEKAKKPSNSIYTKPMDVLKKDPYLSVIIDGCEKKVGKNTFEERFDNMAKEIMHD